MAHLERLGPSSHVLTLKDGTRILFSYGTPVAAWLPCGIRNPVNYALVAEAGYLKTSTFHSRTTSGHVARFLGSNQARAVDQAVLDSLVAGV